MYMTPEDARSDFVLVAAVAVFGGEIIALLFQLPFYPRTGLVGRLLFQVWLFVVIGLVPWLLLRYRDQGAAGLGLTEDRSGLAGGLALSLPIVVIWLVRALRADVVVEGLLGRLTIGGLGDPTVGTADPGADLLVRILVVLALAAGGVLLVPFLVTRSREAFRRTEMKLVEGLRTFGMATVGAALLLGLLAVLGRAVAALDVLLSVGGLATMVLLTDRLVHPVMGTSRATLMAPALVVVATHVLSGRGPLLPTLYTAALGAGVAIVVAALVETRRHAWAIVPLALTAALYPTCLTPLVWGSTC